MKVTPNLGSNIQKSTLNQTDALKTDKMDKGLQSNDSKVSADEIQSSSKVEISEAAQRLKMAKEIASQPDSIDEAKVNRLQKLIDAGEYKLDAQAVADRMVDEHLLMPS